MRGSQLSKSISHWRSLGSSHFWEVVHHRHSKDKVQLPPLQLDTKRERMVHLQAAAER